MFGKEYQRMERFINIWFVFVALMIVVVFVGSGFFIYKVLAYFGVL